MSIFRNLLIISFLTLGSVFYFLTVVSEKPKSTPSAPSSIELLDTEWDQIQKGQWLIGFFDTETEESLSLEKDWEVFAGKCKEKNINVGKVFTTKNPGLYVRFLVTVSPTIFYIKNGVAHEVKQPTRNSLVQLIKDGTWNELKPVSFLRNPFSVQMSLLSHLFVHAVNLYNFEDAIVKRFVSFSSATDIAFGLTFIVVGTFLGLLLTCAFGLLQVFFMDSKYPEDMDEKDKAKVNEEKFDNEIEAEDVVETSEDSSSLRKRKGKETE